LCLQPDWAIEVGSYTLFKFDDLLKDQNSTANLAIEDALSLGTGNNYSKHTSSPPVACG